MSNKYYVLWFLSTCFYPSGTRLYRNACVQTSIAVTVCCVCNALVTQYTLTDWLPRVESIQCVLYPTLYGYNTSTSNAMIVYCCVYHVVFWGIVFDSSGNCCFERLLSWTRNWTQWINVNKESLMYTNRLFMLSL